MRGERPEWRYAKLGRESAYVHVTLLGQLPERVRDGVLSQGAKAGDLSAVVVADISRAERMLATAGPPPGDLKMPRHWWYEDSPAGQVVRATYAYVADLVRLGKLTVPIELGPDEWVKRHVARRWVETELRDQEPPGKARLRKRLESVIDKSFGLSRSPSDDDSLARALDLQEAEIRESLAGPLSAEDERWVAARRKELEKEAEQWKPGLHEQLSWLLVVRAHLLVKDV